MKEDDLANKLSSLDSKEKAIVRELGDRMGYGRIMQLCEEIWREKAFAQGIGGNEHTIGPCGFFMVPCPHPIKDESGHCDICCGSGRVTKGVLAAVQENERLREAIRTWSKADAEVAALPEDAYLNPAQMDDLTAALGRKRAAAANLHAIAVNHGHCNDYPATKGPEPEREVR